MFLKIHKNKQKVILKITLVVGIICWTIICLGFYLLSKKYSTNEQQSEPTSEAVIIVDKLPEVVPESNLDDHSLTTVEVGVKEEPKSIEPKKESVVELKKTVAVVAKPVVVKVAKPVSEYGSLAIAPGVRFTNDRKKVSCKVKGQDHEKSKNGKKKHYDEDCCIDRDEWFDPGCVYHYNDVKYALNGKKPLPK